MGKKSRGSKRKNFLESYFFYRDEAIKVVKSIKNEFKPKSFKNLGLVGLVAVISVVGYLIFLRSDYYPVFVEWVGEHLPLYILFLFSIKVLGVVWPPIPGSVFTIGSVPIIGWPAAYLIDLFGSTAGGSLAYFIGKKYGETFLAKIFDKSTLEKFKKIKVREDHQVESLIVMRIAGGTIVEVLCYIASFYNIGFRNFLIASIISHLITGIPVYFLVGSLLSGTSYIFSGIIFVLFVLILVKFRKRYFDW